MNPPPAAKNYAKILSMITICLQSIAKESMRIAAEKGRTLERLNDSTGTEPVNCGVSCDGTWQKRGFSSRNGCVTAISIDTEKVLDVDTLSRDVSSVSYMNIWTRTVRNTGDGEQTTRYVKQILKVLLLTWKLKVLTIFSRNLWNCIICSIQNIKPGLHVRRKHKHKDVYMCNKHKHKVTYASAEA